jgi:hypothetical protein
MSGYRITAEQRRVLETHGKRLIGFGIAWFALGLIVTVFGYAAASDGGGGVYVVAWGPMLYGVVTVVRGARLISKSRA